MSDVIKRVIIQYQLGHSDVTDWILTDLHCPYCGFKKVWKDISCTDSQDCCCTSCEEIFVESPTNINHPEQVIKQLKATNE